MKIEAQVPGSRRGVATAFQRQELRHTSGIVCELLALVALVAVFATPAQAHLMRAQHGTLNMIEGNVYMVLSLPLSAFGSLDENDDGKVTMIEFNRHRKVVESMVRQRITLSDTTGITTLSGVLLSPVRTHKNVTDSEPQLSQVTVMGRFTLDKDDTALKLKVDLYGTKPEEKKLSITATHPQSRQQNRFELTPARSAHAVF